MLGRKCWHCDKQDWMCVLIEFWGPVFEGLARGLFLGLPLGVLAYLMVWMWNGVKP